MVRLVKLATFGEKDADTPDPPSTSTSITSAVLAAVIITCFILKVSASVRLFCLVLFFVCLFVFGGNELVFVWNFACRCCRLLDACCLLFCFVV